MLDFVEFGKGRRNRCSLDIVQNILIVASVRVKKTRIMYQANLSYLQVQKYLHILLEQGLLKLDGDSGYLITKKGRGFLELYDDYVRRRMRIKKQIDQSARDRGSLEKMCFGNDFVTKKNLGKKGFVREQYAITERK